MNDESKAGDVLSRSGIAITASRPAKKPVIFIRQVENGYTISMDRDGYAYNEKTYVANTREGVVNTISGILTSLEG